MRLFWLFVCSVFNWQGCYHGVRRIGFCYMKPNLDVRKVERLSALHKYHECIVRMSLLRKAVGVCFKDTLQNPFVIDVLFVFSSKYCTTHKELMVQM